MIGHPKDETWALYYSLVQILAYFWLMDYDTMTVTIFEVRMCSFRTKRTVGLLSMLLNLANYV